MVVVSLPDGTQLVFVQASTPEEAYAEFAGEQADQPLEISGQALESAVFTADDSDSSSSGKNTGNTADTTGSGSESSTGDSTGQTGSNNQSNSAQQTNDNRVDGEAITQEFTAESANDANADSSSDAADDSQASSGTDVGPTNDSSGDNTFSNSNDNAGNSNSSSDSFSNSSLNNSSLSNSSLSDSSFSNTSANSSFSSSDSSTSNFSSNSFSDSGYTSNDSSSNNFSSSSSFSSSDSSSSSSGGYSSSDYSSADYSSNSSSSSGYSSSDSSSSDYASSFSSQADNANSSFSTDSGGGFDSSSPFSNSSSSSTTTTTIIIQPPLAPQLENPLSNQHFAAQGTWTFQVPQNTFSDPNAADTLTLTASMTNGSALPTWLQFDSASLTFSGNPPRSMSALSLDLRVTATDNHGASQFDDFTLSLGDVNDTPTLATAIGAQTFSSAGTWQFTVPQNTFADVDDTDNLTLSAKLSDGAALPSWLTFNAATGTFSGNPPPSVNNQVLQLQVTATDLSGTQVNNVFAVTLSNINDAPAVSVPIGQNTTEDASSLAIANIAIGEADSNDNQTVTLNVSHGAISLTTTTGLTFSNGDGSSDASMTFSGTVANINTALATLSYTPTGNFNGVDTLTITTLDSGNSSDTDSVAINVSAVNDGPVITVARHFMVIKIPKLKSTNFANI